MIKPPIFLIVLLSFFFSQAQKESLYITNHKSDSLINPEFREYLGNGFFPTKYFNIDLRYLIKFNQYEGLRSGFGGETNSTFSNKFRVNGYIVYGFRDHNFKYSIGSGVRLAQKTNTWLSVSYTNDLEETGSSIYLTDKRIFQLFQPRLINIDLFYKHITKAITLEHQLGSKLLTATQVSRSNITPTFGYAYVMNDVPYSEYIVSKAQIALNWSPFSSFSFEENGIKEIQVGFPKLTLQVAKSFEGPLGGDFNFTKLDFKMVQRFGESKDHFSEVTVVSGLAIGNAPLTHLYHAYPNNINKETILQRFSVAGINSFETMYFNEFFSDRFVTLQFKHYLAPFKISTHYRPQLVLITRYAVGDMDNLNRHQNISYGTLEKGYTESGFEINKLLFGFGLSLSYRYGAYHLPEFGDNIAFKFTFNMSL